MDLLNGLDLFSGIGGITLALAPWVKPVAYCEKERYAQAVLLSRISSGELADAPIWSDVRKLRGHQLPSVDIIYGGFPCQDISVAGAGAGLEGRRSGLFFEILRLVDETRPGFVFLENVPAIRSRGAERVVKELARRGYDCRWTVISAADVGAPHLRKRWFLLAANPDVLALRIEQQRKSGRRSGAVPAEGEAISRDDGQEKSMADAGAVGQPGERASYHDDGQQPSGDVSDGRREDVADSEELRHPGGRERGSEATTGERSGLNARGSGEALADSEGQSVGAGPRESGATGQRWRRSGYGCIEDAGWWAVEPDICRVAYGIPNRVDRIKSLGNAVVPLQAREAFELLMGLRG